MYSICNFLQSSNPYICNEAAPQEHVLEPIEPVKLFSTIGLLSVGLYYLNIVMLNTTGVVKLLQNGPRGVDYDLFADPYTKGGPDVLAISRSNHRIYFSSVQLIFFPNVLNRHRALASHTDKIFIEQSIHLIRPNKFYLELSSLKLFSSVILRVISNIKFLSSLHIFNSSSLFSKSNASQTSSIITLKFTRDVAVSIL